MSDCTIPPNQVQLPPDHLEGRTPPHYVDLCELCGRLRPGRYIDPDSGPVLLCRRCAYKLGYNVKGGMDGKR